MIQEPQNSWYQCSEGCRGRYQLTEIIYRCPKCGELLEVRHDLDKLRAKSPARWKELFAERLRHLSGGYASGVWRYKEWIYSDIPEKNVVCIDEGNTPLMRASRLAQSTGIDDVSVKLCGNSHTGSFKDLGMTVLVSMVKQMIKQGRKLQAVVCASTGDTSAALAAYCARAEIPSVVLLPKDKISVAQLIQPIANGALTLSLDTDFDGCMRIVKELVQSRDFYLANSMNSLRIEGQKTVAMEIVQQSGWQVPDWVIVPGGNLGNISAIGKGFSEMLQVGLIDRLPRLVCAQAQQANPLYESYRKNFATVETKPAGQTLASAIQIGNPVSIKKAIKVLQETDGIVEQASEAELADAAALADRDGLFVCPQTGVAIAAFQKLVDRGEIKSKDKVVIISTAHGLKFTDFKIKYHENRRTGYKAKYPNAPVETTAEIGSVLEKIEKCLSVNKT